MGVPLAGRTSGGRSRVKCLVPVRGARWDKVLDEVSAAIPRDAVARNGADNQGAFFAHLVHGFVMPVLFNLVIPDALAHNAILNYCHIIDTSSNPRH